MTAPRVRDSTATRRALLDAARELFASDGYDGTTVRAVADKAGVNQALLFRYFGNKEGLFAEAVRGRALSLLDGPPETLLERTVDAVLDPEPGADPFAAVLRGANSLQVGADLRAELSAAYTSAFAALVDTDDPAEAIACAELFLAWLLGIMTMRTMPTTINPDHTVREHVLRAARALLAPPPPRLRSSP